MKLTDVAREYKAALYKKAREVRCEGNPEITKEDMEFVDSREIMPPDEPRPKRPNHPLNSQEEH